MKKTCVLHIGTEKTGTTTIQNFLSRNRLRLRAQGIVYPESPGKQSHTALAVYGLRDDDLSVIRRSSGISNPEELRKYRDRLRNNLNEELRNSDAPAILFSNEHLSSRLLREGEIQRIKVLCDKYAERTRIIVYLRNQVDFLVSSFGTSVKSGSTQKFPFPLDERRIRAMNYHALLKPWQKVFGRQNMTVRRFESADFNKDDLLEDFAAQVPFNTSGFVRPESRNEHLSARELAFVREFNARLPRWVDGNQISERGKIGALLARHSDKACRLTVSPRVAAAIMAEFEKTNKLVSEQYFGGMWQPLFSDPQLVSDIDIDSLLTLNLSDAMDIACKMWARHELRLQRLEARAKRTRGRGRRTDGTEIEETDTS